MNAGVRSKGVDNIETSNDALESAKRLAKGEDLTSAAKSAKDFIEQAIISGAGYQIGNGNGPVNHNFRRR